MTKTLIIKEADFSENKIETVTIIEPVPCTGISLSESSASVVYGGSYTAVPTVIPANTTDEIIWSSNNENFTVNDGVVSINGVGQAVITATCGEQSASVTLTSTATLDIDDFDAESAMYINYSTDFGSLTASGSNTRITYGRIDENGVTIIHHADDGGLGKVVPVHRQRNSQIIIMRFIMAILTVKRFLKHFIYFLPLSHQWKPPYLK